MSLSAEDRELLDEFAEAWRSVGEIPTVSYEAGYAMFTWRSFDDELAQLLYDSHTGSYATAGVRSARASLRALRYATAEVTIELEIAPDHVLGQLIPHVTDRISVVRRGGEDGDPPGDVEIPVDGLGCFDITPWPTSPFRIRIETDGPPISTPWIHLED